MIYLITIGSYSDYRVEYYVDTEEEAVRVCSVLNETENIYRDYYSYKELNKYSGEIKQVDLYRGLRFEISLDNTLHCTSWITTEPFDNEITRIYRNSYGGIINNTDEEKAKKIFYDKLAEFKANEEGI